jgi:hypothetical protein
MSKPSVRDVDAAYKAALIEEHQGYLQRGETKKAGAVAKILMDKHDHDVDPPAKKQTAKKAAAPERADLRRPAENTAEP